MLLHVPGLRRVLILYIDRYLKRERAQGNVPNVAGDSMAPDEATN